MAALSPLSCPLKAFFGITCPTCGLTRSVLYAWNGDFDMSLRFHFGGIVLLMVGVVLFFILSAQKENQILSYIKVLAGRSENRFHTRKVFGVNVVLAISVVAYAVWGFFFRNNI
jgi:hypothetical protein